jgi:hypothetical protein
MVVSIYGGGGSGWWPVSPFDLKYIMPPYWESLSENQLCYQQKFNKQFVNLFSWSYTNIKSSIPTTGHQRNSAREPSA